MELPTYTNIWKIEKRLYKLYDFRLPMPLPVGQVTAFLAIAIPYMLVLTMVGMPFSHTWVWLYVLPPGLLAWLITRPVLEGKRLPELVASQLRYLFEPHTWCRLAPLAERDQIFVWATVWRSAAAGARPRSATSEEGADRPRPAAVDADDPASASPWTKPLRQSDTATRVHARARAGTPVPAESEVVVGPVGAGMAAFAARPVWPIKPAIAAQAPVPQDPVAQEPVAQEPVAQEPVAQEPVAQEPTAQDPAVQKLAVREAVHKPAAVVSATQNSAAQTSASRPPAPSEPAGQAPTELPRVPPSPATRPSPPVRPSLTVRAGGDVARSLPPVERALRQAPEDRPHGWHERVVVVPGGHRPGKPDQLQRHQARARLQLPGPARIVVLGCAAGAGQTTTTLVTGQLLASIRGEAVAVLDIGSGPGSLTQQARRIPQLLPGHRDRSGAAPGSGRERGLQVVTAEAPADEPADAGRLIDAVVNRYRITIADPAAPHVPRAVQAADQLVLVAPASAEAAAALAMTLEWLEAHGNADLARSAVTVLNGVKATTAAHVDKAAGVAAGRCRAIVRVPWDDRLAVGSAVGIATIQAFTALGGVLIAGLARPASTDARTPAGRR